MLRMRSPRLLAAVVVAVVLAAVAVGWRPLAADRLVVTADFADTTGLYVGNEVQYLGVPVGEITGIEPRGTVVRVEMAVDPGTQVPRDAVAEILQSSLLTDRFVQLGPVYTGGPALPDGAHLAADRTRSPISFDDLGAAIDGLVVALDREGPDGRDIGDLLAVTADNLDGNGARVRALLGSSREALAGLNAHEPDLAAIVANLDTIARVLGRRDALVRRFTTNLSTASEVVAGQTRSLDQTLRSLSTLSTEVATFLQRNRADLRADLRAIATVAGTIRSQQDALSRIFDHMPAGAENITRAYDPRTRSLRVQLAAREMAVFNQLLRSEFCRALGGGALCTLLTNPQGTGVLDTFLDAAAGNLPEGLG